MDSVRFPIPSRGVSDAQPFIAQDGLTVPPDAMDNTWPRETGPKRFNLSTRDPWELVAAAGGAAAGKPVQCIGVVGTASDITGFDQVNPTTITTGTSRVSGNWIGQALVLEPNWTVRAVLRDTRGTGATMSAPPASVGGYGAFGCCWNRTDPDVGYFACIGQDTGQTTDPNTITFVARFTLANPDTFTHTAYCVDRDAPYTAPITGPQVALTVSKMAQSGPYLFVAANRYIYVFRADTLVYLKRVPVFMAIEVQSLGTVTIAGKDYLWAASTGSAAITGPIVDDPATSFREAFGEHARSALALFEIQYADATLKTPVAVGGNAIRRKAIPQGTQTGDGAYEPHETFRPSEYGSQRPRGCLIYSMAPAPNGDVFIARTNQGFDYAGNGPDGAPGTDVTVARCVLGAAYDAAPATYISPTTSPTTGTRYGLRSDLGAWEADIEGYRVPFVNGTTTYQTDIPPIVSGSRDPGGAVNAPSAFALAYDAARDLLCVGGYRPDGSANVHGVRGLDGAIRWRRALGATVLQNAIAANPVNGTFIVGTKRNAEWAGSAGAWAELFELDAATGQIRNTFDLTNEVMQNGVFNFSSSPPPLSLNAGAYAVDVHPVTGRVLVALAPFRHSA